MKIIVNLDVVMAQRKMRAGDLAQKIGITNANLSILKNGKAKAIRFSTPSRSMQGTGMPTWRYFGISR